MTYGTIMLYNLRIRPNFIFLPIFIFAFCLLVEGQNKQANKLNILVLDDYTYEGIGNVNISLEGKNIGTTTMANGFGSILVDSYPVKLNISHVAYTTIEKTINSPRFDTVKILLKPRVNILDEIVIASKSKDYIVPSYFTVIDFSICDTLIYTLGSYTNKPHMYKVKVINSSLEPLYTIELTDTIRAESLFCDCLNNCHVLSKNAAYQIVRTDSIWETCCEYDISRFHLIMDDCLFETSDHLIFRQIINDGFSETFYGIDYNTKEKHFFIQTHDFNAQKRMHEELMFLAANPGALRMEFAVRFEKEFMF